MNTLKSLLWALLAVGVMLTGCTREESINVNQDTVYGEYRLVYEANQDRTFARATFRFGGVGGTNLLLSEGAEVTYDDDMMTWRNALAYYEKVFNGVEENGTFSYTDLDGNVFVNEVNMAKAIALPDSLNEISESSAFTLTWEGDPIEAGEIVTVTIIGSNERNDRAFTTADVGDNFIVLRQDKLEDLGLGTAKLTIERRLNADIQQGTSRGGAIWSRYVVGPVDVTIVE